MFIYLSIYLYREKPVVGIKTLLGELLHGFLKISIDFHLSTYWTSHHFLALIIMAFS